MVKEKIKIVVASGKGGVGKSMFASCLATLFAQEKKIVAVDADVDAPNLDLWLGKVKKWDQIKRISVSEKAVVKQKFSPSKECLDICQFGALSVKNNKLVINSFLCEGCGACEIVCPSGAIKMKAVINGEIRVKKNFFNFPLISAQLYPGETGSGKIVDEIKQEAEKFNYDLMIVDAPAGTGCPVIAALKDTNLAILITEPMPAAFSDLRRTLTVVESFNLDWKVVLNKWDINPEMSEKIINWAGNRFLGKISYDKRIFQAISQLKPIMETNLPAKKEIKEIFQRLLSSLKKKGKITL